MDIADDVVESALMKRGAENIEHSFNQVTAGKGTPEGTDGNVRGHGPTHRGEDPLQAELRPTRLALEVLDGKS
jgi:hypothetical protein